MKKIWILVTLSSLLLSQELKIKAQQFDSDEKTGKSIFRGDVNIINGDDEINASKIVVYTDKEHQPIKYIAEGNVSFHLKMENNSSYQGKAQKIIYLPLKKEYSFFKDVYLEQLDSKKTIIGQEVILNTIEGKAYAKGASKTPVIMIFDMPTKKEK